MKKQSKLKSSKTTNKPLTRSRKSFPSAPSTRPAVLITGAGSGIGFSFAEDCLQSPKEWGDLWGKYDTVVMVARNPVKLKETAARLREKFKERKTSDILTLAVDLSAPGSTAAVKNFLKKNRLHLTALINNAGIGHMGEFSDMPIERVGEILRLNIISLTELSHVALENFREQERPAKNPVIINVASVVGFIPFPLNAVYGASKAYVVSFSEALRSECREEIRQRGWGAEVYTLCPGSTRTAFFARAGKEIVPQENPSAKKARGLLGNNRFMDPDQVVKETRNAIALKKSPIIPGAVNRFIPWLGRLLPRPTALAVAHRFMKKRLR